MVLWMLVRETELILRNSFSLALVAVRRSSILAIWISNRVTVGGSEVESWGGTIEFVVVFDVSVGIIKLLMDGFELCVEAWDELAEFMSVVVSTCDICI